MALHLDKDNKTAHFTSSYMERALVDPNGIIAEVREATRGIKYDTIVGTGSSGALIIPIVARALRKKFLIIRKDSEANSSHSGAKFLGTLGKRWIFLDDFCSSGATFHRVRRGVEEAVRQVNRPRYRWDDKTSTAVEGEPGTFSTELLGWISYNLDGSDNAKTWTPWDVNARPGYSDSYWDDTPYVLQAKAAQEARKALYLQGDTTPAGDPISDDAPPATSVCGYSGCSLCEEVMPELPALPPSTPEPTNQPVLLEWEKDLLASFGETAEVSLPEITAGRLNVVQISEPGRYEMVTSLARNKPITVKGI